MIDMKRLDAKRKVRFGDHVDYLGDFGSTYVGLVVDVSKDGTDVVVAKPGANDAHFNPRQLRVAAKR